MNWPARKGFMHKKTLLAAGAAVVFAFGWDVGQRLHSSQSKVPEIESAAENEHCAAGTAGLNAARAKHCARRVSPAE
jgi:hypothetical protein